MKLVESATVEFKRIFDADKVVKTVIAFANTLGGTLYIGIADNGDVVGVSDTDSTCLKVTNTIRDSIIPDVTMFVSCTTETIEGRPVIKVAVQKGTATPYYWREKKLSPAGVFVRHGASTVATSDAAFLKIIKDSAQKENYEELTSLNQALTFNEAAPIFEEKGLILDELLQRKLKLTNNDGDYTNLGLLISDQCPYTVKVSAFRDTAGAGVQSWKEFSGSLLKQNEDVYHFIDIHNDNSIVGIAKTLQRIEKWSFPPEAVREALFNLLIHRDFSISHSSQIKIYTDRIQFLSFGTLLEGMSPEMVLEGVVAHRNRNLAEVFRRLGLIEAFGFGIPKIMDSYKEEKIKPQLKLTDSLFIIVLPNTLADVEKRTLPLNKTEKQSSAIKDEETILRLFESRSFITREDVEEALFVADSMARRRLRQLVGRGILEKIGGSKNTRYRLSKREN